MISIALVPVRTSFLRSRKVATEGAFGFRTWSGLKSKGRNNNNGDASTTKRRVVPKTGNRYRSRNRSTGASDAKPIGRGSAGGFRTISNAGNSVMLIKKAMIIPEPAICPSSERPRYGVGKNDENPMAVAAAASAKG